MTWLTKYLPAILRWLSALFAAGGVVSAKDMAALDNYEAFNYAVTGGWFAASAASVAGTAWMARKYPAGDSAPTAAQSAARVKALRAQAAALNQQADAITTALKSEAIEAEASK